jgi:hypothetical protein
MGVDVTELEGEEISTSWPGVRPQGGRPSATATPGDDADSSDSGSGSGDGSDSTDR